MALISPMGRVSFESVYQPTAMEEGQKKKFKLTLLIPKKPTDPQQIALLKQLYKTANDVCREKFGCDLKNGKYKNKPIKSPFRCGSEKSHLAGYDDSVYAVSFSGQIKPSVVNQRKIIIPEGSSEFYNGCWAHVTYNAFPYDTVSVGVSFGLFNVQKIKDGDPFGAIATDPNQEFDVVGDLEDPEVGVGVGSDVNDDELPY